MAQIESQASSSTSADETLLVQNYATPRSQGFSNHYNNYGNPRRNFNPAAPSFRPFRNFSYRNYQNYSLPNFSQISFRNSDPTQSSGSSAGSAASFNNSKLQHRQLQQALSPEDQSAHEPLAQTPRFVPLLPPFNIVAPADSETCTVCSERRCLWAVSVCSHPVCLCCAAKLLLLCNSPSCSVCRTSLSEVFFVRSVESSDSVCSRRQSFLRLEHSLHVEKGGEQQMMACALCFEDAGVREAFDQLQLHYCALCSDSREHLLSFNTDAQLKQHMSTAHELFYCQICMDHLRLFPFERRSYTRAELNTHVRIGDRTLRRQPPPAGAPELEHRLHALWKDAAESASYRGHPQCPLCQKRLFDDHELFRHRRRDHFLCPICDVDAPNDGAFYFRTIGQLRHHCVTKHHWCHECEASGDREQFMTWMFRTEIDLRAHRLQQHASGLSRAQLAAERTLSPAELNFNLSSGIANRRALQARAPNLVDYVPPPEPTGDTTRLWQRIVQRAEQASAAGVREQVASDDNTSSTASAAAGFERPEPVASEAREEFPSLNPDGSAPVYGGTLFSRWNTPGGRPNGVTGEQDFPALPSGARRNAGRASQASGKWAPRGSAGTQGDEEATNSEPEYPQLGPAAARLPFRPARHTYTAATSAANPNSYWSPSGGNSTSRGSLEYMDMAAGGRRRVHQAPIDYESLLAETTVSSGNWVRLQKGEGRDRDSRDLDLAAPHSNSSNVPDAVDKGKKPDTPRAAKKDARDTKDTKGKKKKEKEKTTAANASAGASSGGAPGKTQSAVFAAEDGEDAFAVEPPPGLRPGADPPDSWEDACDNLAAGPPPGLNTS